MKVINWRDKKYYMGTKPKERVSGFHERVAHVVEYVYEMVPIKATEHTPAIS